MLNRKIVVSSILLTLLISSACKKTVNNIKQDLLVNLITGSNWIVVRYLDGASNVTGEYSPYEFDFNKDGTVNAVNSGVVEATGTWVGSEESESITSSFPGATLPISRLTGVWIVTNTKSKPWRVYSHRFEGAKELVLDLQEK